MTFDIGNWIIQEEDALTAFQIFQPYIFYFHLKHVFKQGKHFLPIPYHLIQMHSGEKWII